MNMNTGEITLTIVNEKSIFGISSKIAVPKDEDFDLPDIREYILGCARGKIGTEENQNVVKDLLQKTGLNVEEISKEPFQVQKCVPGTPRKKCFPNWLLFSRMHILFFHHHPLL